VDQRPGDVAFGRRTDERADEAAASIEAELSPEQVARIDAEDLSSEAFLAWMRDQRPDIGGNRFPGAPGAPREMTEDEREELRATAMAGRADRIGEEGARALPDDPERANAMATARAAGTSDGGAPPRGGYAPTKLLVDSLVELLAERSGG
jgi:hypothetical protein